MKRALNSLGAIPTLSEAQFDDLGRSVLGAWEQGRLAELIAEIAESQDLDESAPPRCVGGSPGAYGSSDR